MDIRLGKSARSSNIHPAFLSIMMTFIDFYRIHTKVHTINMFRECFCCGQPSIGFLNSQLACEACISTVIKPENCQTRTCSICVRRQQTGVDRSNTSCACGYVGLIEPCCPVCLYSRKEDYIVVLRPADEVFWTCEKCGLVGNTTQFCLRCAQEMPLNSLPAASEPDDKSIHREIIPVNPGVPIEPAIEEMQAGNLWKCTTCGYEYNLENVCQRCSQPQASQSPIISLINQLKAYEPTWLCQDCSSPNPSSVPICQRCSCPKDVTGPPCPLCSSLNSPNSRQCRICGNSVISSLLEAPDTSQNRGNPNMVNFAVDMDRVEGEMIRLFRRFFH